MSEYHYTVIFEKAEEGGYLAHVPSLNGLTTEGNTLAEAKEMARDAIRCYLESLAKDKLPFPIEEGANQPIIERLSVAM